MTPSKAPASDSEHANPDALLSEKQAMPHPALSTALPSTNLADEEPALVLEPDLPSDGRDEQGEATVRALPKLPASVDQDGNRVPPKTSI